MTDSPDIPTPPREVQEDAAARETSMMTEEREALRVLSWVRSDTAWSEVPPDDERRESLLRKSLLSRVENALRYRVEETRAEEREKGKYISYADVVRLLREACDREGGQIDFARKHDISPAYVSDVVRERRDPGQGILAALGLVKVTLYARNSGDRNDG